MSAQALRRTGIGVVGDMPWGTHFCQFYATPADLTETLVPYFKAGLEAGELCMWVTSPPLEAREAWAALARAVPDLDEHRRRGRIEIVPYTDWYLLGGSFDRERVLRGWVDKLEAGLAAGFAGLRLTGNTFWLEKADWKGFAQYEAAIDAVLGRYRMLALCTYSLERCGAAEIADVIRNHQFALLKRDGVWERIESFDRRRTREAYARELAAERERLAVTLQSISEGVISTDTTGRVLTVSHVAEQLTGTPEETAAGRPLASTFHLVDGRTGVPEPDPAARVLEEGRVVTLGEHAALAGSGDTRTAIEGTAAAIRGPDGEVVGVGLVFRDATERKRAEAALSEMNRRLQELAEAARQENRELELGNRILQLFVEERGDALFVKALEIVLEGMQSAHGVFGYIDEEGDLRCPSLSALLDSCEVQGKCLHYPRAKWRGLWSRALLEQRSHRSNEPARVPRGHVPVRNNLATPILYQGKPIGLLNLANKATPYTAEDERLLEAIARRIAPSLYAWVLRELREKERSAAEAAVRASENRLKLLSETAEMLLGADATESVVDRLCRKVMDHLDCHAYFNFLLAPGADRLHLRAQAGIPPDVARTLEWLEPGGSVCDFVAREGRPLSLEDLATSADPRGRLVGSLGLQAYCCHPLLAQGRVIGTLSFGTRTRTRFSPDDVALMKAVSDQVSMALQREQTQAALRAANAALTEGDRRKNEFLAVLSHELRNPLTPIRNSLYVLERAVPGGEQARKAHAVIDRQVGQLARLVDDLLDVTRISCGKIRLQRERTDLVDVVRRAVEDHRTLLEDRVLEVRLPEGPAWVDGDPTRLTQVVGNLLSNAAKFTSEEDQVRISLSQARDRAVLEVTDSGLGIDPETLQRLFEPFSQADRSLDRSLGGLGLGLALVKGMVELHGGKVSAHSEGPGRGARFAVELPVSDSAEAPFGSVQALAAPEPRGSVLIVEDNRDAADSLAEALALAGHRVAVAYDGRAGVAKARELQPDFVLCDIGLPAEMDGYAVARALRRDPHAATAYLVALTGYALPDDQRRALDAGFDAHLAKPPDMDALEQLLARESARRASRRPVAS